MKKISHCLLPLALAVLLAVASLSGCSCNGNKNKPVDAQIWTMPSTVKVLRDEDCSEYYTSTPKLTFETAKNEYESAQIFIRPETDIKSYSVEVSDFADGAGNVISKNNFTVYHEKCVEIVTLSSKSSNRPLGWYPDALVPLDKAKEYGETNVKAGQNQGIWFTLYTPADTKAGEYTGIVTIMADGKNFTVPASVTVWDFAVPNESNIRTTYHIFPEYLMGGELNNTPEMYKKYVDYMLDYRISTTNVVCPVGITESAWVDQMKEYAANERCTSYKLGTEYPFDEERQVRLLIENSTEDLNLLEKAFFYPYDEPAADLQVAAKEKNAQLVDMLIGLAKEYDADYLAARGLTKADIEKIPVLITSVAKFPIEGLRTYCPLISEFNTLSDRAKYEEFRRNVYIGKNGELSNTDYGTTWWYTCGINPREPWTTFVIDEELVGSRVISWMQHEYGIDGFLYWGVGSYFQTEGMLDNVNGWQTADIWNIGNSVINTANGDGYIVYPGAKYGIDGPIPSLRLMSIRDGYEDYEYLFKMQAILEEYGEKYGTDALSSALDSLYSSLYSGTVHKTDHNLVLQARRTLASMIELAESDAHAFVSVGETDGEKCETTVEVYAQSGATLNMEGDAVISREPSGEGVKFTYNLPLTSEKNIFEAKLTFDGKATDISVFVSNKVACVSAFETEEEISTWSTSKRASGEEHIALSFNSDKQYVALGNGSMKIDLTGKSDWTPEEREEYTARVTIGKNKFAPDGSIANIDGFELYVFNPQNENVTVIIMLVSRDGSRERTRTLSAFELTPGVNKIRVNDVYKTVWKMGGNDLTKSVTGVAIGLPLSEDDVTLYVDGFSYVSR